jgi:hypothetical protein
MVQKFFFRNLGNKMCSLATRLCIERTELRPGSMTLFYPAALIAPNTVPLLRLSLFQGSIPTDCLSSREERIYSFDIKESVVINGFVNRTEIELPIVPDTNYYFQLEDLSERVCILGPDLFGNRVSSVEFAPMMEEAHG